MYPPPYHQESNFDNIRRTIEGFPLATLISVHEGTACITHIPLVYEKDTSSHGKLIGHMDKNNPHTKLLDQEKIQIIFHGPDAYISPSRYSTVQLPTWNYIKVHIDGFCQVIRSVDNIKRSMVKMAAYLEGPENRYVLTVDDPKMDQLINYVIGFEVEILKWEGKFKLSQDKIQADVTGAKEALLESAQAKAGTFIEETFKSHRQKH